MITTVCNKKHLIGLCLFITAFSSSADEKFRVCADPLNPPYSSKKLDGFENKIAELFAKELKQTVEYTWFPQRIGFIRNTLTAAIDPKAVDSTEFKCDVVMTVPAGSDLTLTTSPYYNSTYVLLIAKGRGWDDIKTAEQLTNLPIQRQAALKIAMFDRGPGTTWMQKNGLLDQGIPYQSMSGDNENIGMQINEDLKAKKIDMVILWGPLATYVTSQNPKGSYAVIPMQSTPDIKFDFAVAMGVRKNDNARKEILDKLITTKASQIQAILKSYNIPLLPIPTQAIVKDDD